MFRLFINKVLQVNSRNIKSILKNSIYIRIIYRQSIISKS